MKKHKQAGFLTILFFLSGSIWGLNGMKMVPLESPLYSYMDMLYIQAGRVPPSDDRPWTEKQFGIYLHYLDISALTLPEKKLYSLLEGQTKGVQQGKKEKYRFKGSIVTSLDTFFASNDSPEYSWMHNYKKRPPMLKIPLELWLFDSLYMDSSLDLKEESTADELVGNHTNWVNMAEPQIDQYFPMRAFLDFGGANWFIQFGRDKVSWGNGQYSNLMLSDNPDKYDFLRFSTYWNEFSLSGMYVTMDPVLPDGTPVRASAFIGHRLEFLPFPFLKLTLNEAVSMIDKGDSTTAVQPIRDFNFLMIYHNWTVPARTNSLLTTEITAVPFRNFSVYGQFAIDEFVTKYEAERGGGGGPGVYGWLAGFKGVIPFGISMVTYGGEGAATSPWLYNRHDPPYFYDVHKYWSFVKDSYQYTIDPIGFKNGPDARVLYLYGRYDIPLLFSFQADFTLISKGETTIFTPYDAHPGDMTPLGIPETTYRIHTGGRYVFSKHFSFGLDLYYRTVLNKNHVTGNDVFNDFEAAALITGIF